MFLFRPLSSFLYAKTSFQTHYCGICGICGTAFAGPAVIIKIVYLNRFPGLHCGFYKACCLNDSCQLLNKQNPLLFWHSLVSRAVSPAPPRLVTAMIHGRCGTQTPRGAPTTTGRPIPRAPRLGRALVTPGDPYPRATLRPTRAQVRD